MRVADNGWSFGPVRPYEKARTRGFHLESVMGDALLRGFADSEPVETTPID